MPQSQQPRRALVLAGGGLKVAFQAGALQVWLDEARDEDGAPLTFHHADGASGGVFNLAMWCQGLSGTEIADRWRRTSPLQGLSVNVRQPYPGSTSVLTYDRFRRTTMNAAWGLDWAKIRSTARSASFNLFNVSRQELLVRSAAEMTEDLLVSAVSLPVWFPAVRCEGETYIDAVFATDANLDAAIESGADELWVVWTVSQRGLWRRGFVNQYFQMIEAMANSRFKLDLDRVRRSNEAIAAGGGGEFGRPITVRCLRAEVPAHYLMDFTNASMREAVDRGVAAARTWCREQGFDVVEQTPPGPADPEGLRFRERMTGFFDFGVDDPATGAARGRALGQRLTLSLTVRIDDEESFERDPGHVASVEGAVECEALGGVLQVVDGELRLLEDDGDFTRKRMVYRLHVLTRLGEPLTVLGRKDVRHDARLDVWPDTTTLKTRIFRGHVTAATSEDELLVGSGVLRLGALALAHQLATFRASGGLGGSVRTLARFGTFFARNLWEVYGSGPGRAGTSARC